MYTVHSNAIYSWFLSKTKPKLVILNRRRSQGSFFFCSRDPLWFWCFFTLSNCLFLFHSDEGPTLETLGFTIRIGSTPTFSYFDLYLYSAYAGKLRLPLLHLSADEMKRHYRRRCRSQIVYDNCKRECKCRNGRLYDCHRVRREFTTMSIADRKAYTRAVRLVSTHPSLKNDYENLLTSHRILFNQRIHEFEYFLPWHRWFILQYENLLRRVDCRITVPYWDYTLTAGAPFAGPLWNETDAGLGGNGEGSPPCVETGPFRKEQWSLIASAGGGCLTRSFIGGPLPDAMALAQLFATFSSAEKDLRDFELMLRSEFHDFVHFAIGGFFGTMSSMDSATAPEFFLLHAMVDKIWADWQEKSPRHAYPPEFVYQTVKMPGTEYYSRDLLNLSKQPRCTAVRYGKPRAKWLPILSRIRKVAGLCRFCINHFWNCARDLG